jgi:DNA-binding transcriptional LysR family regulator
MDRLEAMVVLVAVVETGSFSAASRKLSSPLPTVSRKVAELEAHLNTRLLIRSTRKLTLTDTGAAYVAACKRILEEVEEAERVASGEFSSPRGELIVTAPIVFGRLHVLPAVNEFIAQYPEINVRLLLSDRNVHLIDDHIDLAVRIGPLADSSFVATRVGAVRCVVCASPDYLAGVGMPKVPEDLSSLACIAFDSGASPATWTFTDPDLRATYAVPLHVRLAVNTAEAAIDAAVAGVGVTRVFSYQAAQAVAAKRLKIVLVKYEPEPLPIHVLHVGQGLLPLKTRAFIDFSAPRIRDSAAKAAAMASRKGGLSPRSEENS